MPRSIAIALSGGIDSMMTASLLKRQGHCIFGLHFLTGFESRILEDHSPATCETGVNEWMDRARRNLAPMVEQLEIPLHIIDLRNEFKSRVVDYFTRTYQRGQTPNPCFKCNPSIKFGILFEKAKQLGATHMATGHYAQLRQEADGRIRLFKGVDPIKDQSYFLAGLNQVQLRSALLPLGGYTKKQIREMARVIGLQPAESQESQDICFIRGRNYGEFLQQQPGFKAKPGSIVDLAGKIIGRHRGLHLFTIGQRRGINCPAAEPYYVVRIDPERNHLVVGGKQDLAARSFEVEKINWITPAPNNPNRIQVRVRYRHQAVPATLKPVGENKAQVLFDTPHSAVTPGQGAVFYLADEVLGGGWIR